MLLGFTITLSVTVAVSTANGQCNYSPRAMALVITCTQECGREETLSVIEQDILEHLQQIPHGSKLF
jgi:hypothetical protein